MGLPGAKGAVSIMNSIATEIQRSVDQILI